MLYSYFVGRYSSHYVRLRRQTLLSEGRGHRFESCRVRHKINDLDGCSVPRMEWVWKMGGGLLDHFVLGAVSADPVSAACYTSS